MKFLLLIFIFINLHAQERKLEIGSGLGVISYPDYVGSKSYQSLAIPFPYVQYIGKVFRLDKDGINGKLLGLNGLKLNLSINGSLPANSSNGGIREGMPNLDLTGEIGLKLVYNLFEQGVSKLEFELPLRSVYSTDFSEVTYRGIVSNPLLKYSLNYRFFNIALRAGPAYGDANYHAYYYSVDEQYARVNRSEYKAKSGLSGYKTKVRIVYQKNSLRLGLHFSHHNIEHAVFSNSPLVETNHATYLGLSCAYIFYKSK